MQIFGIETKNAVFVSFEKSYFRDRTMKINGEELKKTNGYDWFQISSVPKSLTRVEEPKVISKIYELKDKTMVNDKIPLTFKYEDVMIEDYEGDYVWIDKYDHLSSLYTLVKTYSEKAIVDIDFEYECVLKSDDFQVSKNVTFRDYVVANWQEGDLLLSRSKVKFREIDKILFPEFVYENNCPLMIDSQQLYSIIRKHIKANIDQNCSKITSDYDFCFTVKRLIHNIEPKTLKIEILKGNGKPYSRRRYKTRVEKISKSYDIFEMTHQKSGYRDYSVLPSLYGKNAQELYDKVERLLNELMEFINKPNNVCPHCEGKGFIGENKKVVLSEFFK